jgi:uncharacterized protein involved in exopolysaccharide biosynthesis
MCAALAFSSTLLTTLLAQTSEGQSNTFDDMGRMLFGGMIVAICSALVIAFIMIKLQSRKKSSSDFISIGDADNQRSE